MCGWICICFSQFELGIRASRTFSLSSLSNGESIIFHRNPTFSTLAPNVLPVKLHRTNYLLWRSQVLPILHLHTDTGYVEGACPCPPQFRVDANSDPTTIEKGYGPGSQAYCQEGDVGMWAHVAWTLWSVQASDVNQVNASSYRKS